ncbi:protein of unknown function [Cupriavidus taiwanensis]|nr:protein of unknown function [Cupriavidus taiwanensis]
MLVHDVSSYGTVRTAAGSWPDGEIRRDGAVHCSWPGCAPILPCIMPAPCRVGFSLI